MRRTTLQGLGVVNGINLDDHVRLIYWTAFSIAGRLTGYRHVEDDELFSAGWVGLAQAARSFDPSRGLRFVTHARHRILGAMLDYLRQHDPLPRPLRAALGACLIDDPTPSQLSVLTHAHFQRVEPAAKEEELPAYELADHLFRKLSPSEKAIAMSYWVEGMTMRDLADARGVTESRISQILTAIRLRLGGPRKRSGNNRRGPKPTRRCAVAPLRAEPPSAEGLVA